MAKKHNISFEEKMKYVERREFGRKGWTGNIDGNGGTYWIWKTFGVRRRQRMKKNCLGRIGPRLTRKRRKLIGERCVTDTQKEL